MDDLISRQAAIRTFLGKVHDDYPMLSDVMIGIFEQLPSVTPKQRTGRWVRRTGMTERCSECDFMGASFYNFCPNCGAKMESEVPDE